MQRIPTLLQKLNELSQTDPGKISAIEIDLMMDYTRVLYADLLEMRNRVHFTTSLTGDDLSHGTGPVTTEQDMPSSTAPAVELDQQVSHYDDIAEEAPPAVQPVTPEPQYDIRKKIGINDKYQFISELFGNDKEAYESTLTRLNDFTNYEEAVEWLDENAHTAYAWDDEQFTVQSFYDLLNNFFASK